ncbi:MAG: hypothetical protein VW169_00120 [Rhodospirillaceae bacterium]
MSKWRERYLTDDDQYGITATPVSPHALGFLDGVLEAGGLFQHVHPFFEGIFKDQNRL